MKTLIVAVTLGIILGATGTAVGGVMVSTWRHSSTAYTCSNNVAGGVDLGAICVSTKRDRIGGRLQVMIDRGSVSIVYNHPKRGGEIYYCRTGLVPVGYHPGGALPHWDRCR
jgi:hypothetical protein